jgi:hypothetical protein
MIERTTIYLGSEKRKLEVDGLLTAFTPGGWPQDAAKPVISQAVQGGDPRLLLDVALAGVRSQDAQLAW